MNVTIEELFGLLLDSVIYIIINVLYFTLFIPVLIITGIVLLINEIKEMLKEIFIL